MDKLAIASEARVLFLKWMSLSLSVSLFVCLITHGLCCNSSVDSDLRSIKKTAIPFSIKSCFAKIRKAC